MVNELRSGVIVSFVDIGEIVDHHCLNLPIITWSKKLSTKILRYQWTLKYRTPQHFRKLYFRMHGWKFLTHFNDVVINSRDNQCIPPLTLWAYFPFRRGVLDEILCDTFVSDLQQVGGFLWVLRFPPPTILTTTIYLKYCWKWCWTP